MSRMQLNSKFVNNMLPEWGRFITTVKPNRGLRDSNYDRLYAYLKQHETHAKENKMMLERFSQNTVDHLALMSNVSNPQRYSPSSSTSTSTQVPQHLEENSHLESSISPMENLIENLTNTLALLTQSYKTFLPQTNNQLRTSSNARNQATVQDGRVVVQNDLALNVDNVFQADDCDAFDSDVDEAPTAQTMFMANLSSTDPITDEAGSSYDSDILSKVQDHDHYQDVVCAHHEEHAMHDSRITPTGLTEGERGFEQTKECYLKEVIPFFKTLKDNFKGIQKALTNETKGMKDVFEELEAEVAHNVVDKKHDAIEWKNLLIANDNLIAECLSKEVFSIATNSELNVARFTKMTVAHTTVEAWCLELEAELANLRNTSHHDNQEELINRFSKHEVNHLNLQLKYQKLKDIFRNNPSTPDKDTPDIDPVFVIGKMQASLQRKDNIIRQLKKQISQLQVTRSDTDSTLKHYKELYDSIKITSAKHIEQVTALTTKNVNLKTQTLEKVNSFSKDQVKPKVLTRGKYAIDVEPIVPRLKNNRDAHLDYLRHLKESVEIIHDILEEAKVVVQIIFWYLDSGCSKHMTGDRSWLMNFVKKFIGTVRFRNDHFGAIMGYGDYVIGDSVIYRVYYVEGLGHNLFSVGHDEVLSNMFATQSLQEQIMVMASAFKSLELRSQNSPTTTATETTTTTNTTLPPPPYQQQSTTEAMMIKRIDELEYIMANLIQENKGLEERLDKHGARLYTLEQLDIPHQVSKAVNEVVTDAVDGAMQAPLRNRFRDLPEADMKEILHQRMWETKSYKSHEDHMQLYEALEKSMNHDHSKVLAKDLVEARKKKKKSHESPKTPPGSLTQ
nr:integrase, catalytic region, zinc finger, CCHC-type, peptidase aspartic, catalytic [Tanacetum cinerariifolium]